MDLMSAILAPENMREAYQRVRRNKGAAGVDGMKVEQLDSHLRSHWSSISQELLEGSYRPQPVKTVFIDKPNGGRRMLGIPTVTDRLIQQAIHLVLAKGYDLSFSPNSYGFRPGRDATQAVKQAQSFMGQGKRWVVDLDLEQFFDRVNHDILMSRLARTIKDRILLKLIRRYLQSGIMIDGVVTARLKGTPQGSPLSPLLSNILLDEFDKELTRRGHCFCRYADDCNIYVQSKKAGERVLASVTRYLEQSLKLKVNQEKSAVDRPWKRQFLGYTVCNRRKPRLKPAKSSVQRFKGKIKQLMRKARGWNIGWTIKQLASRLRGWFNYYRHAEVKNVFEELDGWIRRHLRKILWRQWKRPFTRAKMLMRLGLSEQRAWKSATNGRGAWWNAGASHMNQALPKKLFDRVGLISLIDSYRKFKCTS